MPTSSRRIIGEATPEQAKEAVQDALDRGLNIGLFMSDGTIFSAYDIEERPPIRVHCDGLRHAAVYQTISNHRAAVAQKH